MKLILPFLVFTSIILAQQIELSNPNNLNPDGYIGGISLHFKGGLNGGKTEWEVDKHSMEDIIFKDRFEFGVVVKVPISSNFTLGAFYEYQSRLSEYEGENFLDYQILSDKYEHTGYKIGGFLNIYIKEIF